MGDPAGSGPNGRRRPRPSALLAPSILSCDFARLADEIAAVEEGGAGWIHVDVMDGHFVPNITMGPVIVEGARRSTELPLDVHLMIANPDDYLDAFARAGSDSITVHAEAAPDLRATVARLRELGVGAGLALNPGTGLSAAEPVAAELDLLVVMSVHPGFGGQGYIPASTGKIARASRMLERLGASARIEVDGGVDASNASEVARAGADVLVAGSAVFGHPGGAGAGARAILAQIAGSE